MPGKAIIADTQARSTKKQQEALQGPANSLGNINFVITWHPVKEMSALTCIRSSDSNQAKSGHHCAYCLQEGKTKQLLSVSDTVVAALF